MREQQLPFKLLRMGDLVRLYVWCLPANALCPDINGLQTLTVRESVRPVVPDQQLATVAAVIGHYSPFELMAREPVICSRLPFDFPQLAAHPRRS